MLFADPCAGEERVMTLTNVVADKRSCESHTGVDMHSDDELLHATVCQSNGYDTTNALPMTYSGAVQQTLMLCSALNYPLWTSYKNSHRIATNMQNDQTEDDRREVGDKADCKDCYSSASDYVTANVKREEKATQSQIDYLNLIV
eukprot:GHVH01011503.1.p1 GENE.GHVH01011503.1~~GHVH01011503.1.p1  ORF type:complete len:145 (+),score=19.30 GHVH01011503.1:255-689(+)